MTKRMERTTVALDSVGCKLNQAEIELLAKQLAKAGYRLVSTADDADVYILNTCTVTRVADHKSRQLLRAVKHRNPNARLVVTGCYAERAPQELKGISGVDLVLGNKQKANIVDILEEAGYLHPPAYPASTDTSYDNCRTRAFIKIQDGCYNVCAYCIVPLVRGGEKSMPVNQIITSVNEWVTAGCKEAVLTGTEIGSYYYDGTNLKKLLEQVLSKTGVTRLRLSSLQPAEISPDFIGLWQDKRLCPHFHLSLQSGSNDVLSRMKRRYTTADYQQAVSLIRETLPEAAITTDIIVGLPGETGVEFQESYDFCRKMEFARIHVFPYSVRPGTEAAHMSPMIEDRVKKQRSRIMLDLARESDGKFRQRFLGEILPVLWEKQSGNGIWSGLTDNYIRVYTEIGEDLTNRLLPMKLVEIRNDGVWGELIP